MAEDPTIPDVTPIRAERHDMSSSTLNTPERESRRLKLEAEARQDLAKMQETQVVDSGSRRWIKREHRYESMAKEMRNWSLGQLQEEVDKTMKKYVDKRSDSLKPRTDLTDTREGRYASEVYNNTCTGEASKAAAASEAASLAADSTCSSPKRQQRNLYHSTVAQLKELQNPIFKERGWPILRCNICQDPLRPGPIHSCTLTIMADVVEALRDDVLIPEMSFMADDKTDESGSCAGPTPPLRSPKSQFSSAPSPGLLSPAALSMATSICSNTSQGGFGGGTSSISVVIGGEAASDLRAASVKSPLGARMTSQDGIGSVDDIISVGGGSEMGPFPSPLAVEANGNVVIIQGLGKSGISRRHHFCDPCYLKAIDSVQASVGCPMCRRPVSRERDLVTEMIVKDQWIESV